MPRVLDQNIVQMRKGMSDHLMPPRYLLEKAAAQSNAIAIEAPEKSHFAEPFFQISREHSGSRSKAAARSRSCGDERFRAARVCALYRVYPR